MSNTILNTGLKNKFFREKRLPLLVYQLAPFFWLIPLLTSDFLLEYPEYKYYVLLIFACSLLLDITFVKLFYILIKGKHFSKQLTKRIVEYVILIILISFFMFSRINIFSEKNSYSDEIDQSQLKEMIYQETSYTKYLNTKFIFIIDNSLSVSNQKSGAEDFQKFSSNILLYAKSIFDSISVFTIGDSCKRIDFFREDTEVSIMEKIKKNINLQDTLSNFKDSFQKVDKYLAKNYKNSTILIISDGKPDPVEEESKKMIAEFKSHGVKIIAPVLKNWGNSDYFNILDSDKITITNLDNNAIVMTLFKIMFTELGNIYSRQFAKAKPSEISHQKPINDEFSVDLVQLLFLLAILSLTYHLYKKAKKCDWEMVLKGLETNEGLELNRKKPDLIIFSNIPSVHIQYIPSKKLVFIRNDNSNSYISYGFFLNDGYCNIKNDLKPNEEHSIPSNFSILLYLPIITESKLEYYFLKIADSKKGNNIIWRKVNIPEF